jgi:hypothetical protein
MRMAIGLGRRYACDSIIRMRIAIGLGRRYACDSTIIEKVTVLVRYELYE